MDVEGRGLGEERLHAEDRGTGRRDWCSVRPREKEERASEKGNQTRETFGVYLRTSDKEESLSSDLGRAEN